MTEYYPTILIVAVGVLGYALHALGRRQARPAVIWPREMTLHLRHLSAEYEPLPWPGSAVAEPVGVTSETQTEPVQSGEAETTRFLVDSVTLLTCYHYLFGELSKSGSFGFREVFVYLSGVRVDPRTFVITRLLPVGFAQQHGGGVQVSQPSNIEMFTALDAWELPLVAHAHSHPGAFGPQSTWPSATDRGFQARLEQGGCRAIGLIFARSRDGSVYVRFFAGEETRFSVEVQGAHAEQVEDHVFKLSLDNDQAPLEAAASR